MTHDLSVQTGNGVTESVTSGVSPTPTHDPMCARTPTGVHYVGVCTCRLIAKVRADERQRIIGVMERNADRDGIEIIDAVLDMTFLSIPRGES